MALPLRNRSVTPCRGGLHRREDRSSAARSVTMARGGSMRERGGWTPARQRAGFQPRGRPRAGPAPPSECSWWLAWRSAGVDAPAGLSRVRPSAGRVGGRARSAGPTVVDATPTAGRRGRADGGHRRGLRGPPFAPARPRRGRGRRGGGRLTTLLVKCAVARPDPHVTGTGHGGSFPVRAHGRRRRVVGLGVQLLGREPTLGAWAAAVAAGIVMGSGSSSSVRTGQPTSSAGCC